MGFYNVVKPCVVGKLHYVTVPSQPIEVDDVVAAPLVESGDLEAYPKPVAEVVGEPTEYAPPGALVELAEAGIERTVEEVAAEFFDPLADPELSPRPRNPRRTKA